MSKVRAALFVVLVLFSSALVAPREAMAASATEVESNDTVATATPLTIGDTITGRSYKSGSLTDVDYYRFVVPSASKLGISFTFPDDLDYASIAYSIAITDASESRYFLGAWPATDDPAGAWTKKYSIFLGPGDYYFRVDSADYEPAWGRDYHLKLRLTPGPYEAEPNDARSSATRLRLGKTLTGSSYAAGTSRIWDEDFYKVVVPHTGNVAVKVGFAPDRTAAWAHSLWILDSRGRKVKKWLYRGDGSGGPKSIRLSAGTYYVVVDGWDGERTSGYGRTWGRPYTLRVRPLKQLSRKPTPRIMGVARIGRTLTVRPGTWRPAPVNIRYRWLRNGKAIPGATRAKYVLRAADRRKRIRVRVTAHKNGYVSVVRTSRATAMVR